jgi:transcriptional repressor NrdR
MRCPFCDADDTRVVDSRPADGGDAIRRRRACSRCGHRFTTYERRETALVVRKRDGSLQPFVVAKVRSGIVHAMADRPVAPGVVDALVEEIEAYAREAGPEISSQEIGRRVLAGLRRIDEVAYLRFASVHKDFADASDFHREMAALDDGDG